ncbi:hypothetical protein COCNU_scaffold006362G000050 [Cocos nucifera]|nr:hypothetical protein [Cocos nucifera]
MQAAMGRRGASRGPGARYLRSGAPNLDRPWTSARARAVEAPPHHPTVASRKVPPWGFQWAERHCKRAGVGTRVPRGGRSGLAQEGPESQAAPLPSTPGGNADEADWRTNGPKAGRVERRRAGATEQAQHVRRKPMGGPGPRGRGDPYHPGRHPGKSHPGGSEGPSGIANGRGTGRASRGHRARGLRSGDTSPGPPCRCARAGGPRAGKTGHARAGRGHRSAKHGRRGGKEGEQNVGSVPEGGPGACVRGAPYHPDGGSGQAPPRGFQRTERHCKWAGDGIRVRWAWRPGLARRGPESLANRTARTPGRGPGPPCRYARAGGPRAGKMGHARAGRGHESAKHGRRGGKEGEQNVGSAPEGGPGPCVRGAPYYPGGASGQAPPRGFRRIERHCKWAGDGMRIPWAWRSGLAQRGPESLATPPLRMPGRGRPAHAWSNRGQGSSAQGRRVAEERRLTSAGCPQEELSRATDSTPTTPTGHPGKSNPGGSKGPSGIANGRVLGGTSHGHGDLDLCSRVLNPLSDRPRTAVAPPNTPTGHPDNPNPGGSKGPSGIAKDAHPVGMALGTCTEGTRIPGHPTAAHARARQTGARMV